MRESLLTMFIKFQFLPGSSKFNPAMARKFLTPAGRSRKTSAGVMVWHIHRLVDFTTLNSECSANNLILRSYNWNTEYSDRICRFDSDRLGELSGVRTC